MKVCIIERTNLNEEMLAEEFEIVKDPYLADFIIAQSTVMYPDLINKTIYIATEPPLAEHRLWCYSNFDNFHTVITHHPFLDKQNQFPFTESDEPQYYPTKADPSVIPKYTREDTTIGNRGVFYAGMIGPYEDVPNSFGGINLTKIRRILGDEFAKNPASKIIGIGRNGQATKVNNWRVNKSDEIKESGCDFVLALENTMLPNYLYEKIWDGFASDKVTLYLGDPRVEEHIPTDCFVDLRPYFDKETGEIDVDSVNNHIQNMTQESYDDILNNARAFRETTNGRHQELQDKLTKLIIERING